MSIANVSVSNSHGNNLGNSFRVTYIPVKIEIWNGSFSGVQNKKSSLLSARLSDFRFLPSWFTRFYLIFCFDLLMPEGMISQFRDIRKDSIHKGSRPPASSFHPNCNGFPDIRCPKKIPIESRIQLISFGYFRFRWLSLSWLLLSLEVPFFVLNCKNEFLGPAFFVIFTWLLKFEMQIHTLIYRFMIGIKVK